MTFNLKNIKVDKKHAIKLLQGGFINRDKLAKCGEDNMILLENCPYVLAEKINRFAEIYVETYKDEYELVSSGDYPKIDRLYSTEYTNVSEEVDIAEDIPPVDEEILEEEPIPEDVIIEDIEDEAVEEEEVLEEDVVEEEPEQETVTRIAVDDEVILEEEPKTSNTIQPKPVKLPNPSSVKINNKNTQMYYHNNNHKNHK